MVDVPDYFCYDDADAMMMINDDAMLLMMMVWQ
jgi:hypothetical protein